MLAILGDLADLNSLQLFISKLLLCDLEWFFSEIQSHVVYYCVAIVTVLFCVFVPQHRGMIVVNLNNTVR